MTKENSKILLPNGDNFDLHSDSGPILDWWHQFDAARRDYILRSRIRACSSHRLDTREISEQS